MLDEDAQGGEMVLRAVASGENQGHGSLVAGIVAAGNRPVGKAPLDSLRHEPQVVVGLLKMPSRLFRNRLLHPQDAFGEESLYPLTDKGIIIEQHVKVILFHGRAPHSSLCG